MATQAADALAEGRSKAGARGSYFFWVSVILLALILIGFAPTLYLRMLFPETAEPNMPLHLYLHGGVLTAWFVWLVVQTSLVRTGKAALHRQTGWVGAAIAAGVCIAAPMATFGVIGRLQAQGIDFDTDMSEVPFVGVEGVTMLDFAGPIIWGNLMGVAAFAILIGAAIWMRKRPEYHKRLILVASIGLIPPALARISRWPLFGGEDSPMVPIVALGLLISMTVYDLLKRRKPHPATVISTALVLAGATLSNVVAATSFGQDFVRSLG